jgi:predicted O-methyltransferase YrrM
MRKAFSKVMQSLAREAVSARAEFCRKRPALALREELHRRALAQSVDFIEANCPDALYCSSKAEHLSVAASHAMEGAILEFGVFRGITINQLASIFPDRKIYGFDSFLGLPEDWKGFRYSKENFNRQGVKPDVRENVELVQGWFDETLPGFMKKLTEPVALAHIDCDIYSSTVTVLELITPALREGSVISFDEFFNYPGFQRHEYKAFLEWAAVKNVKYEFISYSGHQAAVKILSIRPHDESLAAG